MSCCTAVTAPRLAYAVVSERNDCFDSPTRIVDAVDQAGFCVLSIVSENPVWAHVGSPPRAMVGGRDALNIPGIDILDPDNSADRPHYRFTPSPNQTEALIRAAIAKGLCVQVVVHLDAIGAVEADGVKAEFDYAPFPGMPWRAQFWFDPNGAPYRDRVVLRLVEAAAVAIRDTVVTGKPDCKPCVSFVLGSEVDLCVAGRGADWQALLAAARAARDGILTTANDRKRLEFGHKINHDFPTGIDGWLDIWSAWHRGGIPASAAQKVAAKSAAALYLSQLDFISFSFYPSLGPSDDWDDPANAARIGTLSDRVRRAYTAMKAALVRLLPPPAAGQKLPCIEIGEAGIGWLDTTQPQQDVPQTDGFPNCNEADLARYRRIKLNYFAALLKFLRDGAAAFSASDCKSECLGDFRTVALWSNHWQFDLIGLNLRKYVDDSGKYSRENGARLRAKFVDSDLDKAAAELLKVYGQLTRGEEVDIDALIERTRQLGATGNGGCLFILLPLILAPFRLLARKRGGASEGASPMQNGNARQVFPSTARSGGVPSER